MGGDACCLEVSRITGQLHRGVNIFDGDYPEGSEPLLESVRRLQQLFGRGANPVTLCQIYPADHAKNSAGERHRVRQAPPSGAASRSAQSPQRSVREKRVGIGGLLRRLREVPGGSTLMAATRLPRPSSSLR